MQPDGTVADTCSFHCEAASISTVSPILLAFIFHTSAASIDVTNVGLPLISPDRSRVCFKHVSHRALFCVVASLRSAPQVSIPKTSSAPKILGGSESATCTPEYHTLRFKRNDSLLEIATPNHRKKKHIHKFPRRLQTQEETPRKQGDTVCCIFFDVYYRPVYLESLLGFGVSSGEFMDHVVETPTTCSVATYPVGVVYES